MTTPPETLRVPTAFVVGAPVVSTPHRDERTTDTGVVVKVYAHRPLVEVRLDQNREVRRGHFRLWAVLL